MGRIRARRLAQLLSWIPCVCGAAAITTHHVDNFRTGWNPQETVLTTANVNTSLFSQQAVVPLDAQIDAQPLVLSNQNVNGTVYSTVVYVASENNIVYAVDGTTGAVLTSIRLEPSVLNSGILSGACNNNDAIVGINSTPVIDAATGTLYVVTATPGSGTIAYNLHALSTSTLADKFPALPITAPGGVTYSRQRSALTLLNGSVVIPFTSFCDLQPATSLGYVVLATMGATSSQTSFQTSFATLSTIWMSGSGPAINGSDIYFSTGNEKVGLPNPVTSPPNTNLPESLVRLHGSAGPPPTLSFGSVITPDTTLLGANDMDFGAGGVLIVPAGAPSSIGPSTAAQFVTGLGKKGVLYASDMSLTSPPLQGINVGGSQSFSNGVCPCGTSYFTGADGLGHVVTSAGTALGLYTVSSSGLTFSTSTSLPTKLSENPGALTAISSNGTSSGTGIIWLVSGPADSQNSLNLYAYNAANLAQLYSYNTGYWPVTTANANTVPAVANGHVYVASYQNLTIWGVAAGALPAVPTGVTADALSFCPSTEVTWNTTPGATSYRLYQVVGIPTWNPGVRQLKSSSASTDVIVKGTTKGQLGGYEVAACNSFGCSNPSSPIWIRVPTTCPPP